MGNRITVRKIFLVSLVLSITVLFLLFTKFGTKITPNPKGVCPADLTKLTEACKK